MFNLTIYDSSEDEYLHFPNLICVLAQVDNILCFSYIDALECINTVTFQLEEPDTFKINFIR